MESKSIISGGLLSAFSDELADAAERVRDSVVEVRAHGHGSGAGTIWRTDGTIITNHHVAPRDGVDVRLRDGREFSAAVIARDEENDLVALKISVSGLTAATPGDAGRLRPGELVFAVGHPFGVLGAMTAGVISAAPSSAEPDGDGRKRELIRADVVLGPGNSGGPLADARGHVVGINAMVAGGMALAVPAHLVERLLARHGERRALGVTVRDVELTPPAAAAAGLASRRAALVVGVAPGGPAWEAGVIVGDLLLTIDGHPLDGAQSLLAALSGHIDDTAQLQSMRGVALREIEVQLVAAEALQAA